MPVADPTYQSSPSTCKVKKRARRGAIPPDGTEGYFQRVGQAFLVLGVWGGPQHRAAAGGWTGGRPLLPRLHSTRGTGGSRGTNDERHVAGAAPAGVG